MANRSDLTFWYNKGIHRYFAMQGTMLKRSATWDERLFLYVDRRKIYLME